MIPKIIHYCWFGHNPLPNSAIKCINSWKKFFPDYEIREWNEDNFDVESIPYMAEAYHMKKYAFVSDYARFWVLYYHGGLYFDTDVEVSPGFRLYKSILDYYGALHFVDADGNMIPGTVVKHTTDVLVLYGLRFTDEIQEVAGVWIYPQDYFNPLDDATGRLNITKNTRSIHWYSKTWVDNYGPARIKITRWIHRIFGVNSLKWLKKANS